MNDLITSNYIAIIIDFTLKAMILRALYHLRSRFISVKFFNWIRVWVTRLYQMFKEYFIKYSSIHSYLRTKISMKEKESFQRVTSLIFSANPTKYQPTPEDLLTGVIKVFDDLETRLSITAAISAVRRCHTAILTRFSWLPMIFWSSFFIRLNFIIVSLENMEQPKASPG